MSTIPTTTVTELPDDAVIVDVREADEWAAGHAPNAVHIPLSDLPARPRAARHRRHDPDRLPQRRTLRPAPWSARPAGLRRRQRRGRDARGTRPGSSSRLRRAPSSDTHPGPWRRPAPSRDDDPPEMTDNRDRFDGTEPDPDADRWSAWLPRSTRRATTPARPTPGRRRRRHRCRRAWPAAEPCPCAAPPMPAQRAYSSYRRRHCCRSPSSGPSPRDATSAWRSSPPSSASPRWASSPSSSPSRSPSCTSRAGWPRPSAHPDAPATGLPPRRLAPWTSTTSVRPVVLRPARPVRHVRASASPHWVDADELVASGARTGASSTPSPTVDGRIPSSRLPTCTELPRGRSRRQGVARWRRSPHPARRARRATRHTPGRAAGHRPG